MLPTVNSQNTYTTQDNDSSLLNQAVDSGNVASCDQLKKPLLAVILKMTATKNTKVTSLMLRKRPAASTTTTSRPPKSYHSSSLPSAMKSSNTLAGQT